MLNNFIGGESFVKGLQSYLEKFKYKNATTENLWNELNQASNKDVKSLMRNWTQKTGYPLVSVCITTPKSFRKKHIHFISKVINIKKVSKKINDNGHTILELKQQRFLKNPEEFNLSTDNTIWSVPITIMTKSSFPRVFKDILLTEQYKTIDLGTLCTNELVYLNVNNVGFYRVKYSKDMFELLLNEFNESTTPIGTSLDKFGLIYDTFAMVKQTRLILV